MTFGTAPFGTAPFAVEGPSSVTTFITPDTPGAWVWVGGVPNINSKTQIFGTTGSWSWLGNAATINSKYFLQPSTALWNWLGNAAIITGGSAVTYYVSRMTKVLQAGAIKTLVGKLG